MKKALVSYQGYVSQIVDPGEDFEIYEGPDATIAWVDAPDNIQPEWTLEWSSSKGEMIWVERDQAYSDSKVARSVAYGTFGDQLGQIFDDIQENGRLDTNSTWFQHCLNVKSLINKPAPDPIPLTLEEILAQDANIEPSIDRMCRASTVELQSWKRYPGWKGYQKD